MTDQGLGGPPCGVGGLAHDHVQAQPEPQHPAGGRRAPAQVGDLGRDRGGRLAPGQVDVHVSRRQVMRRGDEPPK
jgi:hypothetical protein